MSVVTKLNPRSSLLAPHLQPPVLLPVGETEVVYLSHQISNQFNRGVLTVWFDATDYGHVVVPKYYNVSLVGKVGFRAARCSDLVSDYRRVFPRDLKRLDRIPLSWFEDVPIIVELGTVTKNARQEFLADENQYSVIRKIVKVSRR